MHRRLTALLIPPLLALSAACTTPGASAAPQPPATSPTPGTVPSYWPGQEEVMAAAGAVDAHAAARWPDAHAGVATDLPGRAVEVHRIPTPGFDAEIRALVPHVSMRFVGATYSAQTLAGWMERIKADTTYWQRRGVLIHGYGPEMGKHVFLEVENPQRDGAKIAARYRDMALEVKQGWPAVPLTADEGV